MTLKAISYTLLRRFFHELQLLETHPTGKAQEYITDIGGWPMQYP